MFTSNINFYNINLKKVFIRGNKHGNIHKQLVKILFLLTPFFAMSMFLTLSKNHIIKEKRELAIHITDAVSLICIIMYFFGGYVFKIFGITGGAFRVGLEGLLVLSAVSLIKSINNKAQPQEQSYEKYITVVPLATTIIVRPTTIGIILIFGT